MKVSQCEALYFILVEITKFIKAPFEIIDLIGVRHGFDSRGLVVGPECFLDVFDRVLEVEDIGGRLRGRVRLRREKVCTAWRPSSLRSTYMAQSLGWSEHVVVLLGDDEDLIGLRVGRPVRLEAVKPAQVRFPKSR